MGRSIEPNGSKPKFWNGERFASGQPCLQRCLIKIGMRPEDLLERSVLRLPSLHVSPTTTTALLQAAPAPGQLYAQHVNPKWVKLLTLLRMNVQYTRCLGAELQLADGRKILDFLSGYCVHNTGHNHPRIVTALKEELDSLGPAMLQSHASDLAGELAVHLCTLAGGGLNKVFFSNSGSEGVEAAIKFARAHTGRWALLSASGGFHGLTCGALSLMDDPFWRANFGPLLADSLRKVGAQESEHVHPSRKRSGGYRAPRIWPLRPGVSAVARSNHPHPRIILKHRGT